MTINKDIRCENPACINAIEKYGEQYHGVHDLYSVPPSFMLDAIAMCERCGGYYNGKIWVYVCGTCKKEVCAGELEGLFVPHLCYDCLENAIENDRQAGRICRMCHQPYSLCCC